MERLGKFMTAIEKILGTKNKRHIAAGILVSAACMCLGLAATVLTIKSDVVDIPSENIICLD